MPWQEEFLRRVGPSYFGGIGLGEWLALVAENHFAIAPSCWPRAAFISAFSLPNAVVAAIESARFRRQWEQAEIQPPLFILGHYRSGTTHLHNLLALDTRFAFLNAFHDDDDILQPTVRADSDFLQESMPGSVGENRAILAVVVAT